MDFFFNPQSIAVIGASDKGPGSFLLENLQRGFEGKIFPVNPNYEELKGLRCYKSVEHIDDSIDLALMLIPAKAAPDVLQACANKKVSGAIIQSAGFSEVGEKGQDLSSRSLKIAIDGGIRLWGPNCMGLVDVPNKRFFTLMQPAITNIVDLPGRISLVVQSGMLSAGFLADLMSQHHIGVAKVCSLGNKLDVDECDVLEYLLADSETEVIAMYLESLKRGRHFLELASQAKKPIVVLKGGASKAGAKAALSHTASLAGDARLTRSMLSAAGIVEASDFHQMMDLSRALAAFPKLGSSPRVAVVTFSGGAGILTCDLLEKNGLNLAELSPTTIEALSEIFPPWMPPENPVDLFPAMARIGRVNALEKAFNAILNDAGVDFILFHHLIGVDTKEMDLESVRQMSERADKPVVFWGLGLADSVSEFKKSAHAQNIPVYNELSRAIECLSCAANWKPRTDNDTIMKSGQPIEVEDQVQVLDEYESKLVLSKASLPIVQEQTATNPIDALKAAQDIGFPVVLKGLAPGIVHKSELNMVQLNIDNESKLISAAEHIHEKLNGQGQLLVQRQIKGDFELIIGFTIDQQFGPVIMVGLGGVFAELEPDVVFAPAPLNSNQAFSLLRRIRNQKLLDGFRGMSALDRDLMAELLVNLGQFCIEQPKITQVDINPILISDGRPIAVDASLITTGNLEM